MLCNEMRIRVGPTHRSNHDLRHQQLSSEGIGSIFITPAPTPQRWRRENMTKFVRDSEVAAKPPVCSTDDNDMSISEMK